MRRMGRRGSKWRGVTLWGLDDSSLVDPPLMRYHLSSALPVHQRRYPPTIVTPRPRFTPALDYLLPVHPLLGWSSIPPPSPRTIGSGCFRAPICLPPPHQAVLEQKVLLPSARTSQCSGSFQLADCGVMTQDSSSKFSSRRSATTHNRHSRWICRRDPTDPHESMGLEEKKEVP